MYRNIKMQNIPFMLKLPGLDENGEERYLNLKKIFIPDSEQYNLYDLDIANAEMRMLTAYSKDEALTKAFNEGKDLHCLTGAAVSEYSYADLLANKDNKHTEQYKVRQLSKVINFGIIYGMGAETLMTNLWVTQRIKITLEQAEDYINKFFLSYPGVKDYMDSTKRFTIKHGFTYTFTGRRRRFPIVKYNRRARGKAARQAVNSRIQTTSSDVVMTNMIELGKALKKLGGRILLTVHDSIVFQVPKGTKGIKKLLDNIVITSVAEKFPWLPVTWKYDVGMGPSYGEAKYPVT